MNYTEIQLDIYAIKISTKLMMSFFSRLVVCFMLAVGKIWTFDIHTI